MNPPQDHQQDHQQDHPQDQTPDAAATLPGAPVLRLPIALPGAVRRRGHLIERFSALCGACGSEVALADQRATSRARAAMLLRAAGWRYTIEQGWICAACAERALAAEEEAQRHGRQ